MSVYGSDQVGTIETPYLWTIDATADPTCDCALCANNTTVINGAASSPQGELVAGNAAALPYLGCVMTFVRYRKDQWLAAKL